VHVGVEDVLPHDEAALAAGDVAEDGHRVVDPVLGQVIVGAGGILSEPALRAGAEVVAVGLQLVATDVEPVVREDAGQLGVDGLDDVVRLVVDDVELAGRRLDGRVELPDVVGPPRVGARDDVRVDLLPAGGRVARHVDLGDDADTAGAGVLDDVAQVVVRVDLARGVGVPGHLRVGLDGDGPRLRVVEVPVQDVELGQGHGVELLVDLGDGQEVAARVDHDAAVGVERRILDANGLLDEVATVAVVDDELLERGEGVEGAPDGLGRDADGVRVGGDVERVRLVDTVLQVRLVVLNIEVDVDEQGQPPLVLAAAAAAAGGGRGEGRVAGDGRLGGGGRPAQVEDGGDGALPGLVDEGVVGGLEQQRAGEM